MRTIFSKVIFLSSLCTALCLSFNVFTPLAAAASCTAVTNYGSASLSITAPTTTSYRVWSRLQTANAGYNSYLLEVDGSSCYNIGGVSLAPNTWTWVDYQNGSTSSVVTIALSAGAHTFKLIGNAPNVEIDRIIITADPSCVIPTGTGSNCIIASPAPTPSPTTSPTTAPTPSPTTSPTPAPLAVPGDFTHDGHVTIADLAIVLSHWNQAVPANTLGDSTGDGRVTASDLAVILSNWGR